MVMLSAGWFHPGLPVGDGWHKQMASQGAARCRTESTVSEDGFTSDDDLTQPYQHAGAAVEGLADLCVPRGLADRVDGDSSPTGVLPRPVKLSRLCSIQTRSGLHGLLNDPPAKPVKIPRPSGVLSTDPSVKQSTVRYAPMSPLSDPPLESSPHV